MDLKSDNYNYWQDLERPEKITKILDDEFMTDCKFVVGPEDDTAEILHGHKLMFILESPVLERMLNGDFAEAENTEIRINDIDPQDFKNFRYMIYNNKSSNLSKFSLEEIITIHRICDKYMVLSISKKCIQFLKSLCPGKTFNYLIKIYEFATQIEDKTLKAHVEKEISSRFSADLFNPFTDMYYLSRNAFYQYLYFASNSALIKHIEIYRAFYLYVIFNRITEKDIEKLEKSTADHELKDLEDIRSFKNKVFQLIMYNSMSNQEKTLCDYLLKRM